MACCEKCWADARTIAQGSGRDITSEYQELVDDRDGHPCTSAEQDGVYPGGIHEGLRKVLTAEGSRWVENLNPVAFLTVPGTDWGRD